VQRWTVVGGGGGGEGCEAIAAKGGGGAHSCPSPDHLTPPRRSSQPQCSSGPFPR
jgi:hypothetical protein